MEFRINWVLGRLGGLFVFAGPARIVPMEGLRGVAILMVFLVHHAQRFRVWVEPGSWTGGYAGVAHAVGQAGVDVFFAISGYLVYSLALSWRGTVAGFVTRRSMRIYPPFLAAMAVYVVLFATMPNLAKWPKGGEWWFVVRSLLLLPGVFDVEPVMTVAWSLSYELAFYLAIPLLVTVLRFGKWSRPGRVFFIASLALGYCAASLSWFPGRLDGLPLEVWNRPRFLLFAAGMLAWERLDSDRGYGPGSLSQVLAAALMFLSLAACVPLSSPAYQQPWPSIARTLLLGAASFAVMRQAFAGRGWIAGSLSWMPLRVIGNCSYSLYLVHSLGIHAAGAAMQWMAPAGQMGVAAFWLALPMAMVAAAGVTIPLYLFVERPFSLRKPALRDG